MTTAHRPTFNPAVGRADEGGNVYIAPSQQVSVKALPSFTKLKTRQAGQNTVEEIARRDLKKELADREAKARAKRADAKQTGRIALDADVDELKPEQMGTVCSYSSSHTNTAELARLDDDSSSEASSESDDDSSDDEEAELMAELEKIRKERAEEAMKKEQEQQEVDTQQREAAAVISNPLIGSGASFQVKRRWNDDVVFRNQARTEPEEKKRFVNDTIRNDFHRRFMTRFIK